MWDELGIVKLGLAHCWKSLFMTLWDEKRAVFVPFPPGEARPACHPLCTSLRHDSARLPDMTPVSSLTDRPPTGCGERGPPASLAGKRGPRPAEWPRLA